MLLTTTCLCFKFQFLISRIFNLIKFKSVLFLWNSTYLSSLSDARILNLSFKKNSASPHEEPTNNVSLSGSRLFFKKLYCLKKSSFFLKFSKLKLSLNFYYFVLFDNL